jgi:hypothetical protein
MPVYEYMCLDRWMDGRMKEGKKGQFVGQAEMSHTAICGDSTLSI